MTKFTVVYTIEGAIEFDAPNAAEAMRKFEKRDQRELGELGELVVLTEPLEEEVVAAVERGLSHAAEVVAGGTS